MSDRVKHSLKVVPGPTGAPWCVFGAETGPCDPGIAWSGPFEAFDALDVAGKLLGPDAIFCAELTARWRSLVVCTPAFLAWARERECSSTVSGAPPGFAVEVLS